jgi:hypothetical protein
MYTLRLYVVTTCYKRKPEVAHYGLMHALRLCVVASCHKRKLNVMTASQHYPKSVSAKLAGTEVEPLILGQLLGGQVPP